MAADGDYELLPQPKTVVKFQVNIIESERGWGSKIDEIKLFDDYTKAVEYVDKENSKNTSPSVPDIYWYAEKPFAVLVDIETNRVIKRI